MEAMKKYLMPLIVIVGLAVVTTLAACSTVTPSEVVQEAPDEIAADEVVESESAEVVSDSAEIEDAAIPPPLLTDDYEIVTLLPKDAIPSIDNPEFLTVAEAGEEYAPEELVMGVDFNGERRAYSTSLLSSHEIVNDVVGGKNIAVTW